MSEPRTLIVVNKLDDARRCGDGVSSKRLALLVTALALLGARTAQAQVNVTTFHNDNQRTGWNASETLLTPANVNTANFKVLFKRSTDDQVYGQPLYLAGVGSPPRDLVYAVTLNNTVYAFDADDPTATSPVWTRAFGNPILQSDLPNAGNCGLVANKMGIVSTPVIDAATGTMYVVTMSHETNGSFVHRVRALDVATGADKMAAHDINFPGFDGLLLMQRAALALNNGRLYVSFASHCDGGTYHGFVVELDAATLTQGSMVFNPTPNGNGGGIWGSGNGPAFDSTGNLFIVTGNGDGASNLAQSFVKLAFDPTAVDSPGHTFAMADFFKTTLPEQTDDVDLDVTGPLFLPNTHFLVDGDKQGEIYVVDTNNLSASPQILVYGPTTPVTATNARSIAYFNSSANNAALIYVWSKSQVLKSFRFNGAGFDPNAFKQGAVTSSGSPGGLLSVSSSVDGNGRGVNGILWANETGGLRAYDADNLGAELWNSTQTAGDACGAASKNAPPTIANGKVYLASWSNQVCVYGLNPPPAPTNLAATPASNQVSLVWAAVSGAVSYKVKRGTTTGGPYTILASNVPSNTFVDTTALNGTQYFYVVQAVGIGSMSGFSNEASATPSAGGTTTTLNPVADSYVKSGANANANFGTQTALQVKNAISGQPDNSRRAYLKFDISGVGTTISSAKLRLFGASVVGNTSDGAFGITNTTWTETGITWNNAPALPGSPLVSTTIATTSKYYEWDVTSFVAGQKSGGATQISLAVAMATVISGTQDSFNARENTTNKPQLVVVSSSGSNAAPTVATPASATPNPVTGSTTALSVLGADDGGEAALTYTWSATGTPPAPVTFSPNGSNAAKNSTATFTKAGNYNLQAKIADRGGLSVTSSVAVTVSATLTAITVSPASASVAVNGTQQFTATAKDQFGTTISPTPTITWMVSGGGSISSSGLFSAGSTGGGPFTVTAASVGTNGTAQVTVTSGSTTTTLNTTADAFVKSGTNANTNFGNATTGLEVKNADPVAQPNNSRRTFVKFNISTVGTTVTSAKLRLFGSRPSTSGTWSDNAYGITDSTWTETGITWNNAPVLPGTALASVVVTPTAQYYEWDVTSFVATQRSGGATQVSLALAGATTITTTQDTFNSREVGGNPPQLVIISTP
jgi:hypothetical protein